MEIETSNGIVMGRVKGVLWGTDATGQRQSLAQLGVRETEDTEDEDAATAGDVADAVLTGWCEPSGDTIFVPHQAVASVSGQRVKLFVDDQAVEVSTWRTPPAWVRAEGHAGSS
jgi:hypothetical protein